MATITPANLAYKDKDGDLGEVKSLTDTDVTLLNNALQDIEDLKLAYMPGYVKRDFSNVTQDGKDAAIGWGMPDYSAGIIIQQPYTAPSDGVVSVATWTGTGGQNNYCFVNGTVVSGFTSGGVSATNSSQLFVQKGDVITWNNVGDSIRFFPLKGAN